MFAALIESSDLRGATSKKLAATAATAKVTTSNVVVNADGSVTFTTNVAVSNPAPAPTPTPAPTPAPKFTQVSRLFEYYATRKIEGTVNEDSGATIRDAIKTGVKYGILDEASWPYNIQKFTVNPTPDLWAKAATKLITSYHSIADGDIATMKSTLAMGYLVGFGFQVYDYFMTADMAKKALLGLPGPTEHLQGGHAVALVGYDDAKKMPDGTTGAFLVRNSWGVNWGLAGYFWMSYAYAKNTQLASDFWVVVSDNF